MTAIVAESNYVHPQEDDAEVKWIVRHSRMTDVLYFGPFDSLQEAQDWCNRNGASGPMPLIPPRVEDGGYAALWAGWKHARPNRSPRGET